MLLAWEVENSVVPLLEQLLISWEQSEAIILELCESGQTLAMSRGVLDKKKAGILQWILAFCVRATVPNPPAPQQVAMGMAAHYSGVACWCRDGQEGPCPKKLGLYV